MTTMIYTIFNFFGQNGPLILFITSIFLLYDKQTLLIYYTIGFLLNMVINLMLKGIIQQPRPDIDTTKFNVAMKHGKRFIFNNGFPYDIFGMPSGHSESCLFSATFVFLSLHNQQHLFMYLLTSIVTMTQRVFHNHHTVLQVIVGSMVGILVGYLFFNLSKSKLSGIIEPKKDDNAPLN